MSAVIAIITIIGNDWLKTAREGRESQIKCLEQKITEFVILCVHLGQRLDFTDEETEIQGGNMVVNGESFPFLFSPLFFLMLQKTIPLSIQPSAPSRCYDSPLSMISFILTLPFSSNTFPQTEALPKSLSF